AVNHREEALESVFVNSLLAGVGVVLSSADLDVACITEGVLEVGSMASGEVIAVGSLDVAQPGFTFKVSDTLESPSPADPARIDLCVFVVANEIKRFSGPPCFFLQADLNLPADATQILTLGPDGLPDTADDGITLENFDIDKDGDGVFSVDDTFLQALDVGGTLSYTGTPGLYMRGSDSTDGPNTVRVVACGGFDDAADGNPACILDPDFPMDWHFHCPNGAADCPNDEILPGDSGTRTCVGGCSYDTPPGGDLAFSLPNSLHMGAHFDPTGVSGDSTHLRALQAFVSAPLNLTPIPGPDHPELSFFHVADLVDSNLHGALHDQCADCADVQIQVDMNHDPAIDEWSVWDKLVPFQNVYDKIPTVPVFGPYYCLFTPADTGTLPPAPRGAHETICDRQGAWSHCGVDRAAGTYPNNDCSGPGFEDPAGFGLWAQSKFDLSQFLGQRVRIRWIGASWVFDRSASSYFEIGGGWDNLANDDGWWLDDIRIAGTTQVPSLPALDSAPPPGGSCPIETCSDLDGDGYGFPGFHTCPAGAQTDCDDGNANVSPGSSEICDGLDTDCDGNFSFQERDDDHDGFPRCADCRFSDPNTYPGAAEINDRLDNQCPGDLRYGVVDEISGDAGFHNAADNTVYSWPAQINATLYDVVRSRSPRFERCTHLSATDTTFVSDPRLPNAGRAFYYMVRPVSPAVGSWGQDSSRNERAVCP
ncbi:MAG: MopE-related protein, partial [Acidobacteriota bacterium]